MANSIWDYSEFTNLTPEGRIPLALTNTKVEDIKSRELPAIVNAPTKQDAINLYEKMIKDMNAAGATKIEEEITRNYKASKGQ